MIPHLHLKEYCFTSANFTTGLKSNYFTLPLRGASLDVILRRTDADTKPPSVEHHRGQCVTLASTSDWSRSGPLLPQHWHGNLVHVQLILWHCNTPPFIHCNRHCMYSKKESIRVFLFQNLKSTEPTQVLRFWTTSTYVVSRDPVCWIIYKKWNIVIPILKNTVGL